MKPWQPSLHLASCLPFPPPPLSLLSSLSLFLSLTPSLSHSRRNTITSIVLYWPSSRTLPAPLRRCILYQQMQLLTYFKQPSSYDPPPPPAILEICIAFGMACVCLPTWWTMCRMLQLIFACFAYGFGIVQLVPPTTQQWAHTQRERFMQTLVMYVVHSPSGSLL